MIARIKKDSQDNLTWERLTSAVVGSTPLGAVYGIWSNTVPEGFLPCNGAQFDKTQYPFLYNMLGTDYLPDLRECTLVGIGENSTDTLSTHDIYTLGQFKDFATAGFSAAKTAGYTISGNSVILNSTVNPANRKLVTQYVADADATDLQNLQTSSDIVTRMRSKGINYIIKAIPGNEVGDYNYVIDQMEAQLALKISLDYVNALPTGSDIESNIYGYNGHYYIGDSEHATLTQLANASDLTALQPKTLDTSLTIGGQTITTVEDALSALNTVKLEKGIIDVNALPVSPDIEDLVYRYNGDIYFGDSTNQTTTLLDAEAIVMVDESDPLPTGADIKAKLYVQPETIGSSTKYHYYVGDTTVTPHVLIEMSTGGSDIFVGTQAEWNNLSAAEQAQYTQANITDVNSVVNVPVDTIADGNMNPVTSNAVYDKLDVVGQVYNISPAAFTLSGASQQVNCGALNKGKYLIVVSLLSYITYNNCRLFVGPASAVDIGACHDITASIQQTGIGFANITADNTTPVLLFEGNLSGSTNGDTNHWYVKAIRIG